jgi:hypothetical protein
MSLPPVADKDDVEYVRRICRAGQAIISRKRDKQTERLMTQVWNVKLQRLGVAVAEHIELRRKVYVKPDEHGRPLFGMMQANVTLADDLDVYVEIELKGNRLVILAAHGHYTTPLSQ